MTKQHDWTEDQEHENGNYQCRCIVCSAWFIGHKRRVLCKHCADNNPHDTTKAQVALDPLPGE